MTTGLHFYFGDDAFNTFEVARVTQIKVPMPMLYVTAMKDGRLRVEMSTAIGDVGKFERLELVRDEPSPALTCCTKCGAVRSNRGLEQP